MSTFILSDKHISTIALLLVKQDYWQEFANKLKAVNIKSVNFRYDEKTRITKCKLVQMDACLKITMDDLYQLCNCWDYQSCEGNLLDFQILQGYIEYTLHKLGYPKDYDSNSKLWSI